MRTKELLYWFVHSEPQEYEINENEEKQKQRENVANNFIYSSQGSTVIKVEETSVLRGNIMLLFPDKYKQGSFFLTNWQNF